MVPLDGMGKSIGRFRDLLPLYTIIRYDTIIIPLYTIIRYDKESIIIRDHYMYIYIYYLGTYYIRDLWYII